MSENIIQSQKTYGAAPKTPPPRSPDLQQLPADRNNESAANQTGGCCFRLKTTLSSVEVVQPAIIAISLTYMLALVSSKLGLSEEVPAVTQFTHFCCIVGLVASAVFYTKPLYIESQQKILNVLYNFLIILLIGLYIGHWFLVLAHCPMNDHHAIHFILYCSTPLHLVLHSAYMLCNIYCLIINLRSSLT